MAEDKYYVDPKVIRYIGNKVRNILNSAGFVKTANIEDSAVTTAKINDSAVTDVKVNFLPLSIANGGTGQTTAAAARNALGLGNTTGALPIANGGTGQTTAAAARNALGLGNTTGALPLANGGTGATTAAAARNALGLGNTTGALPVANGGTGATTAANALKNLGFTTPTWTALEGSLSSGSTKRNGIAYTKIGNLVFVEIDSGGTWGYAANTSSTIGTLPTGYRPQFGMEFPMGYKGTSLSGTVRIGSDGKITTSSAASTAYWIASCIFFV